VTVASQLPRGRGDAPTVLVADDSAFQRALTRRALEDEGLVVVGEAGDGEHVSDLYRRLGPDAVLLDLHMPGRDGLAVLRHLRGIDPAATVVVCSAERREAKVLAALELGASDYVAKPWQAEELVGTLRRALGRAA
jgi:two-component system chemotaxis response regulator CheY